MNNIIAKGARVRRVGELDQETFEIEFQTLDLFAWEEKTGISQLDH